MKRASLFTMAFMVMTVMAACHPETVPMNDVTLVSEDDGAGAITTVGFTVSAAEVDRLVEGAIAGEAVESYDAEVADKTFVNHVQFNYNPNGHGPPGVNDVPHFDVHFYGISNEDRLAITCDGQTEPATELVPEGYDASATGGEPFGSCVPAMGFHAGDADANDGPLDAELILGYDRDQLIFIEPMIHADRFTNRDTIELSIARPPALGRSTRWPDTFTMRFDDATGLFHMMLSDFSAIE